MKQILFIPILVLAFSFVAFAQTNENSCPKITIKAPETVQPDEKFKIFASFENETQPSASKFNWTIIKENKISKIKESGIIEIDAKDVEDGRTIIFLAESIDQNCQNIAMASVVVLPVCILPYKIDEYSELSWNDEKARLANVVFSIKEFEDADLFINFKFEKKTSKARKKEYVIKVFKYLTEARGFGKNRITILISEWERESISFQPMPREISNSYYCDDCVVIRGEDLEKIADIFNK